MDNQYIVVASVVSGIVVIIIITIIAILIYNRKKKRIHNNEMILSISDRDTKNTSNTDSKSQLSQDDRKLRSSGSSSSDDTSSESTSTSEGEIDVVVISGAPFYHQENKTTVNFEKQMRTSESTKTTYSTGHATDASPVEVGGGLWYKTETAFEIDKKIIGQEDNQISQTQKKQVTLPVQNLESSNTKSKTNFDVLNKKLKSDKNREKGDKLKKSERQKPNSIRKKYQVPSLVGTEKSSKPSKSKSVITEKNMFDKKEESGIKSRKCKCDFLKLIVNQPRKRRRVSKQKLLLEQDIRMIMEDPFLRKNLSVCKSDYRIIIPKLRFPHLRTPRKKGKRVNRRPKSVPRDSKLHHK